MLYGYDAEKAHVWKIAITKCFVFVLASFVAAARDSFFMSKNADQCIVSDGLGMLVPMPDRMASWTDDLGFSSIVH